MTESCINQMFFVSWSLNFFWVVLVDNNWWLFWVHFNRICLIQPLDSATNTTIWKSKKLSIYPKEHIIDLNKSVKSLGAISKQLQVPRSTVQTTVSIKFISQLSHCLDEKNTNFHQLKKTGQDGPESTKIHHKASLQCIRSCWKTGVSTVKCVFTLTCAERLLWNKALAQLKFAADHMDKEKTF